MLTPHILAAEPKEELPDSRLRECNRTTICGPFGLMSRVYCANCGTDGGLVTEDWAEHIMYICNDCSFTSGALPGRTQIPDDVVRGKTADPVLEHLLK